MRPYSSFKLACLLLFLASVLPGIALAQCVSGEIIPGSYIVKHKTSTEPQGLSMEARQTLRARRLAQAGLQRIASLVSVDGQIEIASASQVPFSYSALAQSASFEYVVPNRKVCSFEAGHRVSGKVRMANASTPEFPPTFAYWKFLTGRLYQWQSLTGSGALVPGMLYDANRLDGAGYYFISPQRVLAWDGNRDGIPDILSHDSIAAGSHGTSVSGSSVALWQGDAQGSVTQRLENLFGDLVRQFKAPQETDLNSDGSIDLVDFEESKLFMVSAGVASVVRDFGEDHVISDVRDIDHDGDVDVLVSATEWIEIPELESSERFSRYDVYRNAGSGNFDPLTSFYRYEEGLYNNDRGSGFADLDADGDYDIVMVSTDWWIEGMLGRHVQFAPGVFASSYVEAQAAGRPYRFGEFLLRDLNADGYPELAAIADPLHCDEYPFAIWANQGGAFPVSAAVTKNVGCIIRFSLSDIDGDGAPDVLLSMQDGTFRVLINTSSAGVVSFSNPITLISGAQGGSEILAFDPAAVAGVRVRLTSASGSVFETESNGKGEFSFSRIPSGSYMLSATRSGYIVQPVGASSLSVSSNIENVRLEALRTLPALPGYQPPAGAPDDPGFGFLWGLDNRGVLPGAVPGVDMKVLEAWGTTRGSRDTVIAILDSGVDYQHPDLSENMWRNPAEIPSNGVDEDQNGTADDVFGYDAADNDGDPMGDASNHGTHVAGTAAARANNTRGISGVCPECRIMPVKVFSSRADGASTADIIKGLDYIARMRDRGVGVRVVNASLGGPGVCNQAYLDMLAALAQRSVLFVAAAGNGGDDGVGDNNDEVPFEPAGCAAANLIAVANLRADGNLNGSSNFGLRSVHVAGPGSEILSTVLNGHYEALGGTSMAAPHVAGVAGLLFSLRPDLSATQAKDVLASSVTPLSQLSGRLVSGGIVNAASALSSVSGNGGGGGMPTPPPSGQPTPPSGGDVFTLSAFVANKTSVGKKGGAVQFQVAFSAQPEGFRTGWIELRAGKKVRRQRLQFLGFVSGEFRYRAVAKFKPPKNSASFKRALQYASTLIMLTPSGGEHRVAGPTVVVGKGRR